MWSIKRGGFLPAWRSALLALLWLAFFFIGPLSPLTAQSTTSGPQRPDTKPKSVMVSVDDLLTLRNKIASLESDSLALSELVAKLQQELSDSETAQQMLSDSLTESSTALESLTRASEARSALDQKAIESARAQRMAWAGGGFLVGAGLAVVTVVLFRR